MNVINSGEVYVLVSFEVPFNAIVSRVTAIYNKIEINNYF